VDKLQRSFKNMNTEVSRNGGKGTSKMWYTENYQSGISKSNHINITLSINELNTPIKIQRLIQWIKKSYLSSVREPL
jgi:hypothetical protein